MSDWLSLLSDRPGHLLGLCCVVTPEGTGQTRMVGMGAPDTSGIDLNPAKFRDRADLVYVLDQLYTSIGRPSYRDLHETGKSMGIELHPSTISDLIGEKSKTRTSKPAWKTVELFVLVCGVPETELGGWRAAWEAAVAPDKPTWQEEQQHLLAQLAATEARASQLATDLAAAQERIAQLTTPELTAGEPPVDQPAVREVEPLERLRIQADTHHDHKDYAAAADLYKHIVAHVEREHGPGDLRTLQAHRRLLEIETEAWTGTRLGGEWKFNMWFRLITRRTLNARWRHLIREYQQHLPEGDRATLELRLAHIYWGAVLLLEHTYWDATLFKERDKRSTTMLPAARKLLIGLHADCKIHLPPGDPFTAKIAEYVDSPGKLIHSRPDDDR